MKRIAEEIVRMKRAKLSHHQADIQAVIIDGGVSSTDIGSSATSLDTSVPENIPNSPPALPTRALAKSSSGGAEWTKLTRLSQLLSRSAQVFGPLKSAIDVISNGVILFENESRGREEYRVLKVELESLFDDLSGYFTGPSPPAVTSVMTRMAERIEKEVSLVEEKQERNKMSRYTDAAKNEYEVLDCYRRIQSLLRRLALNVDMNILEIVDEQAMKIRIKELPSSSAATYMSAHSESMGRGECTPNTRAKVLQQMHEWAYAAGSHKIYWLNGMAGTGKTTIAYSICAQLDRARKLAASFFCSRQLPECRDVNRIIPSIAYQLSLFSSPFRRALSDLLKEHPEAHNRPLAVQFEQLIIEPLQEVASDFSTDKVVVIDALDECDDKASVDRLLSVILEKAHILPLRFLVTSRPEAKILDRMRMEENERIRTELRLHELDRTTVQEDIHTYLMFQLSRMNLSQNQLEVLVKRSDGLFIYAATVVRYVGSDNFSMGPDRVDEVLSIFVSLSADVNREIDALYTVILKSAFGNNLSSTDRKCMELLLHTIVCAQEPLTIDTLAKLTGLDTNRAVRPRLRPLLSVLHISDSTGVVTTLHESFPDFILNLNRSQKFYCDPGLHHARMSHMCFDVIGKSYPSFNICSLRSSYLFDNAVPEIEEKIEQSISEAMYYACRYWGGHMSQADLSPELAHRLEQFLCTRLLLWLEVMNLKNHVSDGARALYSRTQMLHCTVEAKELMQDAIEFITVLSSGGVLRSTPHIYMSGLAFWPKERPISKHYRPRAVGIVEVRGTALVNRQLALLGRINTEFPPLCVIYSPNGAQIVSGHIDCTAHIWDAHTGQSVGQPLKGHTEYVSTIAYSSDGAIIASGSYDKTVRIWNARTGRQIGQPLTGHTGIVLSVIFSLDNARIVSGSTDKTIRIWDAHTGQQVGLPLEGHTRDVLTIACSPDGTRIASGSRDKTVRVWDTQTGAQIGPPLRWHDAPVNKIVYSPDGARIISGCGYYMVQIHDTDTGQRIGAPLYVDGQIFTVAFSPSGIQIVSGSATGSIRIWDALSGQQVGLIDEKIEGNWNLAVAYWSEGARIVSCNDESNSICIWNAHVGRQTRASQEEDLQHISCLAYSPDSAFLASGNSAGNAIVIWDTQTGQRVGQPMKDHSDSISSISYSNDGLHLVTSGRDCSICIWDACTGQQIGCLQGHTQLVNSVIYSPDNTSIASGSADKTIRIWGTHTGRQIGEPLEGHTLSVMSVAYSSDGACIASGSCDMTVRIWDVPAGRQLGLPLRGHRSHIVSIAYSPDRVHVASGSLDKTIRIWNTLTGQQVGLALEGHTKSVYSVTYSPDGALIASGAGDRTARIWDVYSGCQIDQTLEGHTQSINSVAFSPCGQYLASGADGIRIWNVHVAREALTLKHPVASMLAHSCTRISSQLSQLSHLEPRLSQPADLGNVNCGSYNYHDKWVLQSNGWVVVGGHNLLVWVPPDLRRQLCLPNNPLYITNRGCIQLDFNSAKLGERWSECYQAQISC